MIALARIAFLAGWRFWGGALAGAIVALVPAYHAGVFIEAQTCRERIARSVAEHDIRRMERENDRIAQAQAARARAGARRPDGTLGMPDDGFRRD